MPRTVSCVVFACVIAAGLANPATQLPCRDETTQCEVSNVDITPCSNRDRCSFKIGKNASINFDFVPQFAAQELETLVTTRLQGNEVSLPGFDTDACKFTSCPVSPGQKQTLTYNLPLKKGVVAKGLYDIKWKLWNKANDQQKCCFVTRIRLNN